VVSGTTIYGTGDGIKMRNRKKPLSLLSSFLLTVRSNDDCVCINQGLQKLGRLPKFVTGFFTCSDNQLTTADGSPVKVEGDAFYHNNRLTDISGLPKYVGGDLYIDQDSGLSEEQIRKISNIQGKVIFIE
jgi:hypothetical protein